MARHGGGGEDGGTVDASGIDGVLAIGAVMGSSNHDVTSFSYGSEGSNGKVTTISDGDGQASNATDARDSHSTEKASQLAENKSPLRNEPHRASGECEPWALRALLIGTTCSCCRGFTVFVLWRNDDGEPCRDLFLIH